MSSILDRPNSIDDLRAEEQERPAYRDDTSEEMSYADIAAKGPNQSDEEKMPDPVPEIAHDDSSVHGLDSVYGVKSVPSSSISGESDDPLSQTAEAAEKNAEDFGRKAESAADDLKRDAKSAYEETKKDTKAKVNALAEEANRKFQTVKKEGAQDFEDASHEADKQADKAEKKIKETGREAEKKAKEVGREVKKDVKKGEDWAEKNKGNPVVVGNAFVIAAVGGVLAVGGYRKHQAGDLTWKVASAWAGVVGLLAVGDYFVSSWLFQNKYPPRK